MGGKWGPWWCGRGPGDTQSGGTGPAGGHWECKRGTLGTPLGGGGKGHGWGELGGCWDHRGGRLDGSRGSLGREGRTTVSLGTTGTPPPRGHRTTGPAWGQQDPVPMPTAGTAGCPPLTPPPFPVAEALTLGARGLLSSARGRFRGFYPGPGLSRAPCPRPWPTWGGGGSGGGGGSSRAVGERWRRRGAGARCPSWC